MNEKDKLEKPEIKPVKKVVLTITADDEGVKVDGPLKNEAMCFWMLEKAKDTIKMFNMQQPSKIIKPQGGIMNFVRRR